MAGFEQEFIARVLAATDIVDLVGAVVPLTKRTGDNLFGRCPFHKENTPSFSVNKRKQIFHCFGCGEGGDAIGWLMKFEKVTFVESVRRLAERAKIDLPRYRPGADDSQNEALYRLHDLAQKFYADRLNNQEDATAKLAMEYLLKRGLTPDTIKDCGIGLSPANWDSFANLALREGFRTEQLLGSGLCGRAETGNTYDRFRDRIMFPIQNLSGRIVAFGGRILPGSTENAKYINSPETSIYRKSEILYGMPWARDEVRKQEAVIVVEGYLDLISLHQFGVRNAVATSGTALTIRQARLLHRFAPKVFLVYDGDEAGRRASLRGGDVMVAEGLDVVVAFLPEGDDPDTFVQKNGAEAFRELLTTGSGWLDHQYNHAANMGLLNTPSGTVTALRELVRVLKEMSDTTVQDFWSKRIAQRFLVTETIVRHELSKIATVNRVEDENEIDAAEEWNEDEIQIISFLLKYRKHAGDLENHKRIHRWLKAEYFSSLAMRALYDLFIRKWLEENTFPSMDDIHAVMKNYPTGEHWVDTILSTPLSLPQSELNPTGMDSLMERLYQHDLAMVENAIRKIVVPVLEKQQNDLDYAIARTIKPNEQSDLFKKKRMIAQQKKQLMVNGFLPHS